MWRVVSLGGAACFMAMAWFVFRAYRNYRERLKHCPKTQAVIAEITSRRIGDVWSYYARGETQEGQPFEVQIPIWYRRGRTITLLVVENGFEWGHSIRAVSTLLLACFIGAVGLVFIGLALFLDV